MAVIIICVVMMSCLAGIIYYGLKTTRIVSNSEYMMSKTKDQQNAYYRNRNRSE